MTAEIRSILDNLVSFYDFRGKHVIHAGAGGGSLIGYADLARKVTAVDQDAVTVARLREKIGEADIAGKFEVVTADFLETALRGDVVLLEFCLHEMSDPVAAIRHARIVAPDVVGIGHARDSPWSWYANESERVAMSWDAIGKFAVRQQACFVSSRHFRDYAALAGKFRLLGETSWRRIARFDGQKDIVIPMRYCTFLI